MFNKIKNKHTKRILKIIVWMGGVVVVVGMLFCVLFHFFYPNLLFDTLNTLDNIEGYYRKIVDPCYVLVDSDEYNPKKDYLITKDRVCVRYNRCSSTSELKTVRGADPKTFESLGDNYGKDKNNVYYDGKKIVDADLETFENLDYHRYARDKNNVYYYGRKIDGADLDTFTIEWSGTQDKNYKYFGSGRIKNDEK